MDRVLFPEVLTNSLKLKLMFGAFHHATGSSSADGVCSSSWDIKYNISVSLSTLFTSPCWFVG